MPVGGHARPRCGFTPCVTRTTVLLLLSLTLLPGVTACHGPARLRSDNVAEADRAEALAGARAARDVERRFGGVLSDDAFTRRVERVLHRLARSGAELPSGCRVRLLDSETCNAISLPGGRIYVTVGLYRRLTRDELLAAVIAHEMAHLVAGDHFADRPRCADAALAVEVRADARAAQYLRTAGIPVSALVELLELIRGEQPPDWAEGRRARLASIVE